MSRLRSCSSTRSQETKLEDSAWRSMKLGWPVVAIQTTVQRDVLVWRDAVEPRGREVVLAGAAETRELGEERVAANRRHAVVAHGHNGRVQNVEEAPEQEVARGGVRVGQVVQQLEVELLVDLVLEVHHLADADDVSLRKVVLGAAAGVQQLLGALSRVKRTTLADGAGKGADDALDQVLVRDVGGRVDVARRVGDVVGGPGRRYGSEGAVGVLQHVQKLGVEGVQQLRQRLQEAGVEGFEVLVWDRGNGVQ
ncbi:2-isopropylmalate synthase [Babesia caballi]|uniref:2-isopropylmalate synthase n=1 Tax=Babesia caballi TaxID=5871 RepID=A0AAV4M2R3_BABCB|nr:2-isopropylmalate synthase [Babesia caballi]